MWTSRITILSVLYSLPWLWILNMTQSGMINILLFLLNNPDMSETLPSEIPFCPHAHCRQHRAFWKLYEIQCGVLQKQCTLSYLDYLNTGNLVSGVTHEKKTSTNADELSSSIQNVQICKGLNRTVEKAVFLLKKVEPYKITCKSIQHIIPKSQGRPCKTQQLMHGGNLQATYW